jgi:hypothetical protein
LDLSSCSVGAARQIPPIASIPLVGIEDFAIEVITEHQCPASFGRIGTHACWNQQYSHANHRSPNPYPKAKKPKIAFHNDQFLVERKENYELMIQFTIGYLIDIKVKQGSYFSPLQKHADT